jgi:coenzyme F420-reducing hydrogenase beta subunit
MIDVKDKSLCCGCTACSSICSRKAIEMLPDVLGFCYPKVDSSKCVNCGLCDRVCAFTTEQKLSQTNEFPDCYAARHKKVDDVDRSRSGAAFIAFSDVMLRDGGVVYGVAFDSNMVVRHQKAATAQERDLFRGSKYVQSALGETFGSVKKDLAQGLPVLFSGTACQIAGLKSFIPQKLQEKLFTVGIICHGVPSPFIFKDYLLFMERKYGKKILSFNFRDKKVNGWDDHVESMMFSDGTFISSTIFTNLFYRNNSLRESCYKCPFANTDRIEDITIGDFWGWEKAVPEFNMDNKGVSLVLVNNSKGRDLFEKSENELIYTSVSLGSCLQRNLSQPTPRPADRDSLEKGYARLGFKYIEKNYISPSILKKIERRLLRYGRKLFKKN